VTKQLQFLDRCNATTNKLNLYALYIFMAHPYKTMFIDNWWDLECKYNAFKVISILNIYNHKTTYSSSYISI